MAHRRQHTEPGSPAAGRDGHAERLLDRDLTALARERRLAPTHGMDERVSELLALLSGGAKHPVLVGEPGVGKSALVREVARRMPSGGRLVELSLSGVIAREGPRHAADALEALFRHLAQQEGTVVALRDVAAAVEGPLAPVLGSALRAGTPRFLLEIDARDLPPLLRSEETLGDLLHVVMIPEPTPERTRWILGQVSEVLEAELHVPIDPAACELALRVSTRFLLSRRLPRKAIELLEETAQEVAGAGRDRVVPEDVLARFCATTRLPRFVVDDSVPLDLSETERFFSERLLGQGEAIQAVLRSVALLKAGLNDPRRPLGVFLFAGPTGVGKTHLAKLVADYLFGSADRLVRLNMSDFGDDGDENIPFGSPWAESLSRRRGELAKQLDGKVFAVLLLDEFEKASRSVHDRFLQLFDEGNFVNAAGETISCSNTLIIATSNVGAEVYREQALGFGSGARSPEELIAEVDRRISGAFRHEFLNRFDAICHFQPLGKEEIRRIAQREVGRVLEREGIRARALDVEVAPDVLDLLVERGHSSEFGARYLQREIEKSLTTALAVEIARRPLPSGTPVHVSVGAQGRIVARAEPLEPAREATAQLVLHSSRALAVKRRLDRRSLLAEVNALSGRAKRAGEAAGREELETRRRELLAQTQAPDLWDDPVKAAETLRAFRGVESVLAELERIAQACTFARKLVREAKGEAQLSTAARQVEDLARQIQLAEAMAAAGGTAKGDEALIDLSALEASEGGIAWLDELVAMYSAWAERRGYGCQVIAEADEPPRRVLRVEGPGVRAFLAGEVGVHRRVLDASKLRAVFRLLAFPDAIGDDVAVNGREVRRRAGRAVPRLEAEAVAKHPASGRVVTLEGAGPLGELERLAAVLASSPLEAGEEVRRYLLGRGARVEDPRTGVGTPRVKDVLRGDIDVFLTAWISGGASHFFKAR